MLQFGIIPTSEFLYLMINHATDAIKTVVYMVNMKFRKLKKNNVRNINKTRQLKQEVLELSSKCSVGIENKRSFVEIKPVPVVKHGNLTIIFAKVV